MAKISGKLLFDPNFDPQSVRERYLAILEHFAGQQERTLLNKQKFIQAYRKHRANITHAAKEAGIETKTFYNWKKTDPLFNLALELAFDIEMDKDRALRALLYELFFSEEYWGAHFYLRMDRTKLRTIYIALRNGVYGGDPELRWGMEGV